MDGGGGGVTSTQSKREEYMKTYEVANLIINK